MQRRPVDTSSGNCIIPVFLHRPTSNNTRHQTEGGVDGEVYDEAEEESLSAAFGEDALALEQDGELDREVRHGIGDDSGVEGLEEVGKKV